MKKTNLFLLATFAIIANFSYAGGLQLLGEGSKEENNANYCKKIQSVTQDSVDDLAQSWQVNSNDIALRGSKLISGTTACCVILDTPKGPFKNTVWQYYSADKGKIVARMNNRGYKPSEYQQICDF